MQKKSISEGVLWHGGEFSDSRLQYAVCSDRLHPGGVKFKRGIKDTAKEWSIRCKEQRACSSSEH